MRLCANTSSQRHAVTTDLAISRTFCRLGKANKQRRGGKLEIGCKANATPRKKPDVGAIGNPNTRLRNPRDCHEISRNGAVHTPPIKSLHVFLCVRARLYITMCVVCKSADPAVHVQVDPKPPKTTYCRDEILCCGFKSAWGVIHGGCSRRSNFKVPWQL